MAIFRVWRSHFAQFYLSRLLIIALLVVALGGERLAQGEAPQALLHLAKDTPLLLLLLTFGLVFSVILVGRAV